MRKTEVRSEEKGERSKEPLPFTPHSSLLTPHVSLHIGELVLHGVSPLHRQHVADAMTLVLTRALTEQAPHFTDAASLDAGVIELSHNSQPEALGVKIAKAVYEQLLKGGKQ
jgi:hypothetical protein